MNAMAKHKTWTLPGGIHPPENKTQSLGSPISIAPIPTEIILPLGMHIGAPAEAIVSIGDKVLKGQMIAKPKGFVSAAIHASTSGTITAIEPRAIVHASGMNAPCIIIETDGLDTWHPLTPASDYSTLDKNDLLEIINNAGIAGMGGAGFPSRVKLATDKTIEQLIINGTECEPYITADDILMQEKAGEIIEGIKVLQHLLCPQETLIGVENNKPQAINALQAAAKDTNIKIVVFPTKYPSGGEKQLIKILTGKEVKSGGLPADVGVVCQNIGTTQAIYRAIHFGEPLISRITTVTGNAVSTPKNYEVILGTQVKDLLALSGYDANKSGRVIAGGPMMGFTIQTTDVPVVKTTNCILAPDTKELPAPPPAQACIRCGICAEACPASLLPQQLYWFSQAKDQDGLKKHHLMDCIECGACSFVCPSNIPLVQYYRASKADIRQTEQDTKKAEYAKTRFEARLERLEKAEAEKEAKRKARQAKANAPKQTTTDKATIAEALARTEKKKAPTSTLTPEKTDDPVAAAIARAKAKASGDAPKLSPLDKAKETVSSLEKRLKKSKDKLDAAASSNDQNLPAFEASVEKLETKLKDAKKALVDLTPIEAAKDTASAPENDDPIAAAIAKAQAARGGADKLSPEDKLKKDITGLEKRVKATEEKYQIAKDSGDDKADILQTSLEKMRSKLSSAQAELAKLTKPAAIEPVVEEQVKEQPVPSDDPVQAAIERAKNKRQSAEALSPEARLQKDLISLDKRIKSTQTKFEAAKAAGDDKADILESTLAKFQDKRAKLQAELESL